MCDRCETVQKPRPEDRKNKRPASWGTVRLTVTDGSADNWLVCPPCQDEFRAVMGAPGGEDFE